MQDQVLNQIICLYKTRQLDVAKLCDFNSREFFMPQTQAEAMGRCYILKHSLSGRIRMA